MNSGAVAVIVLLNGLQIGLPAPAFVQQGRTWFPARAVLTAAGIPVTHEPARDRVTIGEDARLTVNLPDLTVQSAAETAELSPTPARRMDGRLYLPASVLEPLGLGVAWDNATKTLSITSRSSPPQPLSISEILDAPIRHLGSRLITTGEHCRLWTRPPVTADIRAFWRLQGPSESIPYTRSDGADVQTGPLQEGRRIAVTGRLRMSRAGLVYLVADRITPIGGPAALSVSIGAARKTYRPGDTVLMIAEASNLLDKPIKIESMPHLAITNPQNQKVHTVALDIQSPLQPAEHWRSEETWGIPEQAIEGRYRLQLEHDTVWAHQTYFEVGEAK